MLVVSGQQGFVAVDQVEIALGPLEIFARFDSEPFAVLLDSAADPEGRGRYSIVAAGPAFVLSAWSPSAASADDNGEAELELRCWGAARFGSDPRVTRYRGSAFEELARCLDTWQLPEQARAAFADLPFITGAIGFASYDAGRFLERLPERAQPDLPAPEYGWLFVDAVFVHDHGSGVTRLIVTGRGQSAVTAEHACTQLRASFEARLQQGASPQPSAAAVHVGPVRAYADAARYTATVRAAQAHVLAGDVFEVCTAHRLEASYTGSAWPLYRALRALSPAAFACFVRTPWALLLSSSPERFLSLDREGHAESRPIKGTRPRGHDPHSDERLRMELLSSEKDRAENVMIVDLVRNDFGRVCEVDSVHVPELMIIEQHPRVWHMVSTVRGRLARGQRAVDLFSACFPPGSMTGAPKIEAMKIIDALEPYRRSIYAGAVGYFDASGALDFSVVIRSFVIANGRCCFSVGGAVVADSDPHAEYLETMDKARALLEALAVCRDGAGPST